ncbi:hypothetical protein [Pseudothauera hydrothermalis]|uniref:hypothetical protein n=1 Tax=Pseudothauera hydrothermalis TaxID=2184083 RepID=UPI000E096AF1|nr:hypothetical protein [Pseudothauera hydrothermalis]
MPSLLTSLFASALAAVPVALMWDTATAVLVASVMAVVLWPLMAMACGLLDRLIDMLGHALSMGLIGRIRSNQRQGEEEQ